MRTVGISVGIGVPLGANFPGIETNFVSAILGRLRRSRITGSPKLHGLHLANSTVAILEEHCLQNPSVSQLHSLPKHANLHQLDMFT